MEQIGGQDRPGIGFGIGLERTLLILEHQGIGLPNPAELDVYLVALGENAERKSVELLQEWRKAGLSADRDYMGRKIKAQMKAAVRAGARYAAILGDQELERGEIALKRLADEHQEVVSLTDVPRKIRQQEESGHHEHE